MTRTTRRQFLSTSAAFGVAFWLRPRPSRAGTISPNETLNFACVGVGGKGNSDTRDAGNHGNIVALCDIDDNQLNGMAKNFPDAKKYNDFRKMLDAVGKDIDAVTVSTPDHMHASVAYRAMKMGKHAFVQKPMTWCVAEARLLRETAAEKGLATQMGNQGTAGTGLREAVEIVRAGALGAVKEVHVWTNRPIWPQGIPRPEGSKPVPDHIHWDLFLGVAKKRPFVPDVYHPFKWRGWLDYGTGALGDMACHTLNMPFMALDLYDPITLDAKSSGVVDKETYPKSCIIKYEFPARGDLPPVTLTWYDGGKRPPRNLFQGQKPSGSGALLVGEKGSLYSGGDYGGSYKLLPEDDYKAFKKPEPTLPRSPGHFKEWVIACKGGPKAMSNFDYAGRLTETVVLGNLAVVLGKKIQWDAKAMKATNAPEADWLIKREYRKGWEL